MPDSIHIIGSKICGGAERFYARLINSLAQESQVLAINPPNSPISKLIDRNVPQTHLKMKNKYDALSTLQIRNIEKKNGPCIIQTYMGRATQLTRLPKKCGSVHVARLGGYYKLKSYRHPHHLIGNTKGICDYLLKEGVPPERVHYIGNFVEPIEAPPKMEQTALRQSLGIPDDAMIITCAARFHENKGLPELLEAFALLKQNPLPCPIRLILVGDGPMADELRQKINSLGLSNHVILPGWCDPAPYYHLGDILACPSRHEPLGNVILEAWACKKPLITTQNQGATEMAVHKQDAWITPLKDATALAEGLEQLIKAPSLRIELAAAGYEKVTKQFSRKVITGNYTRLYQEIMSTRK